jgi:hypothetical protein
MLIFLLSCQYLNPEKAGIYGCDEYCEQLISRTEVCADEEGLTVDELVATVKPDWEGLSRDEIITNCDQMITDQGKSEASCQTETGTFNNLSCDDIIGVWDTVVPG